MNPRTTLLLWGVAALAIFAGVVVNLNTNTVFHRTKVKGDGAFDRAAYDYTGWYEQHGDLQGVQRSEYTPFERALKEQRRVENAAPGDLWAHQVRSSRTPENIRDIEKAEVGGTVGKWLSVLGLLACLAGCIPPHRVRKHRLVLLVMGAALAFAGTVIFGLLIESASVEPSVIPTHDVVLTSGGATTLARILWVLAALAAVVGWKLRWRGQSEDAEVGRPVVAGAQVPNDDALPQQSPPGRTSRQTHSFWTKSAPWLFHWRVFPGLAALSIFILILNGGLWAASVSEGRAWARFAWGFSGYEITGSSGTQTTSDAKSYAELEDAAREHRDNRGAEALRNLEKHGDISLVVVILCGAGFLVLILAARIPAPWRLGTHALLALVNGVVIVSFLASLSGFTEKHLTGSGAPQEFGVAWASWLAGFVPFLALLVALRRQAQRWVTRRSNATPKPAAS